MVRHPQERRFLLLRLVDRDDGDFAVRALKRGDRDVAVVRRRRKAHGALRDILREVREAVVRRLQRQLLRVGVHMDRCRAASVAVMVRAAGLVEQQVPVDRGLHAVVHVAEDLARILHRAVLRAAARHAEAVLGLDQHLVRERLVRQAERVEMVAGVPVEADAPHALPHGRIAQRVAGALVDALLVVVPDDELHRDAVRVEHWAEMVADQLRFALRRIAAALPGLRRPRLVLHGHRGNLHALRRVALEIARDVFGPRRFPLVEQLAAGARAAVGFHPGRRAPRRGEQEQLRRSGDDILHHRQDVLAVLPEVEGLHLTVARLGVRILLRREIAAADMHAAELVAEPLL